MTSAYPAPVEVLIPQAREFAATLGRVPSRNLLMGQFKIGAKKATQLLAALSESEGETGRRLHSVPTHAAEPTTGAPTTGAEHEPTESSEDDTTEPATAPVPAQSGPPAPVTGPRQLSAPANPAARPAVARWDWTRRMPTSWPLILLALPAFVAIWSGWVGLGELTGFGVVHPLPGIADRFTLNTAITLPIGVETYAAYALRVALASAAAPDRARRFARWSAVASLALGFLGQVAYHLMAIRHVTSAPWPITTIVSGLPVVVLGCGAALAHLQHHATEPTKPTKPTG